MAGTITFYNSDLSVFTKAFMFTYWAYGFGGPRDILATLKEKVDDSGKFDRIEILDHGSPGMASIGSSSTIASSTGVVHHDAGMLPFWQGLSPYLNRTSGLVLNMCNVGRNDEGRVLLQTIQGLTGGIVYGAIQDMTRQVGMVYYNDRTLYRHYMH